MGTMSYAFLKSINEPRKRLQFVSNQSSLIFLLLRLFCGPTLVNLDQSSDLTDTFLFWAETRLGIPQEVVSLKRRDHSWYVELSLQTQSSHTQASNSYKPLELFMSLKSPVFGTQTIVEVIKSSRMFPFKMAFSTLSNIHAKPFPSRGYLHRIFTLYTSPPIPSIPNPFPFPIVFTIFCTSLQVMSAFQYSSLPHIPYLCSEASSPQTSPSTRNPYYDHLLFTLPSIE